MDQYGTSYQVKVLSLLLTHKEFIQNTADALNSDDFSNPAHKWIIDKIIEYFNKYHTNPSIDFMKIESKKVENDILKTSILEQLKEAYRTPKDDSEYVEQEFQNFCTNQQIKKAIRTSVDLLAISDYDGIKNLINKALKTGQEKNVGLVYEKDIEQRYRDEDRGPIPFPWPAFNNITEGGCGKGELILIFGNPKGGKSWATIAMAVHAAKLGKNVIYYTLELSEGYVGKRMDANLINIPVNEVKQHRKEIEKATSELKGKIIVKGYSAGRASLDTIENHLQQLKYQFDFKPDIIFIDYLDLLKNRNRNRKDKTEDLDDVYTDARGLATEMGVPMVSPSQINRAGAQDDIIQSDKIAGSYSKIMIGDLVISLSRKRKDKLNGTGRWHIMGNRHGPDGLTFNSKIDTSMGFIEIDEEPIDDEDLSIPSESQNTYNPKITDKEKNRLEKFLKI